MLRAVLPKVGDSVATDKFWVSETNMRASMPFGETEEDKALVGHFVRSRVVQPFKARPEGDGYGVVIGRRRFLAMKAAGFREFTVGVHVWIEEMTDDEAREASLKENMEEFRKNPDPVTRGEAIAAYLSRLPSGGIRRLARAWNMPRTTLQDYLKILELSQRMRDAVRRGLVGFYDGLQVARLKLGVESQDRLATIAEENSEAFKRELARLMAGKGKRGIPRGVYLVDRVIWDKRSRTDINNYKKLKRLAEAKGVTVPELIKDYIVRHIEDIAKEAA